MPVGDTVPTGIVVDGQELILYFWGSGSGLPYLDTAWREVSSGRVSDHGPWAGTSFLDGDDGFVYLYQMVLTDRTLVEFGSFNGAVSKIVCDDHGSVVEARFAQWSRDRSVTIFWLHRRGDPVPENTPAGEGRTVPLAPVRYPLISAYDQAGRVIGATRLRPPGTEQKGG